VESIAEVNDWLSRFYGGVAVGSMDIPKCGGLSLYLIEETYKSLDLNSAVVSKFMDDPPYWIFCWASGVVLAQQIMAGQLQVKGKVVVDFGAGSGVVGVAAALSGAKRVYCCEIDPLARQMVGFNARLNGVSVSVVSSMVDVDQKVDQILVADVLYDRTNIPLLDEIKTYASEVILADSRIKDLVVPGFELYSEVSSCSYPDFAESQEFNAVRLYQFKK